MRALSGVRFLPDRHFECKPYFSMDTEWRHRMNPASASGMPYVMLKCNAMILLMEMVAGELHRELTDNP